jgi:hypothetical protein
LCFVDLKATEMNHWGLSFNCTVTSDYKHVYFDKKSTPNKIT